MAQPPPPNSAAAAPGYPAYAQPQGYATTGVPAQTGAYAQGSYMQPSMSQQSHMAQQQPMTQQYASGMHQYTQSPVNSMRPPSSYPGSTPTMPSQHQPMHMTAPPQATHETPASMMASTSTPSTNSTGNPPPKRTKPQTPLVTGDQLASFCETLDSFVPTIPDEVVQYYLKRAGVDPADTRVYVTLCRVASARFVSY
jgi:hypothetical protein